jgi:L-threonylcarbamoyladenylate synthase
VARALLEACGRPVAAPSANPSTRLSPTTAAHVAEGLAMSAGTVLDGGPTPVGIESTVISLVDRPTMLRPGAIAAEEIEEIVGPLDRPGPAAPDTSPGATPRAAALPSPGMLDRHYAPRATLRLFGAEERDRAVAEIKAAGTAGRTTGALLRTPLDAPLDHVVPMPDRPEEYARLLYASLHALDRAGAGEVWVEGVPEGAPWEAIRDRLRRATTR